LASGRTYTVPSSPLSGVRGGQGRALYPVTHSLDRDVQNLGGLGHGIKRRLVIDRPLLAPLCASLPRLNGWIDGHAQAASRHPESPQRSVYEGTAPSPSGHNGRVPITARDDSPHRASWIPGFRSQMNTSLSRCPHLRWFLCTPPQYRRFR
jgi:hypothetical protein